LRIRGAVKRQEDAGMPHATHVLLATAIRDHADAYENALEKQGVHVHVARSGEDALTAARGHTPDCIVIDLRLPDMSGWALCAQLKRLPGVRATPVIVLTPDISVRHCDDGVRAGCHAWLARPTVAEDLVETIGVVMEQAQSQPRSADAALIGTHHACPACASSHVRATLRISPVQYYRCVDCGFYWRVEVVPVERSA
jgi:DNA-binding response OmpR family regulator